MANRLGSQAGKSPPVMSPSRGGAHPAGGEAHADQVSGAQRRALRHVLQIIEAEVVLAPLAHHRLACADLRIGIDGVALAFDLALQSPGVGGDPHRRSVGFGPEGGRGRDSPGSCRSRCPLRPASAWGAPSRSPRLEGEGGLGGEAGLGGAGLVEAGAGQEGRSAAAAPPRTSPAWSRAPRQARSPPTPARGTRRRGRRPARRGRSGAT